MLRTQGGDHARLDRHLGGVPAFGHEEHPGGIDPADLLEHGQHLHEIVGFSHDELDLVLGKTVQEAAQGFPVGAQAAVPFPPGTLGIRVGGLWRNRQQIAGEIRRHGRRRLHGQVQTRSPKLAGEQTDLTLQQRLATGDHHVFDPRRPSLGHEILQRTPIALGQPRGVGGVAPAAAQIAPRCPDEERRHPDENPLALEGGEGLRDEHGGMILPTPAPGDSRWERCQAAFRLLKERDGSGARHLFAAKSEPGTGSAQGRGDRRLERDAVAASASAAAADSGTETDADAG